MITKTVRCDLCDSVLLPTNAGRRLRWHSNGIDFCTLTDPAASEKAICGDCLGSLKKALVGYVDERPQ